MCVTVADADISMIGSLKSPQTFFKYLYSMLVEFEQNRMSKLDENLSFLTRILSFVNYF